MGPLAYLSIGLLGWLLVGPFPSGTYAQHVCPSTDRVNYGGKSYCLILDEKSWHQAQLWCNSNWGQLASFRCGSAPKQISDFLKQKQNLFSVWFDPPVQYTRNGTVVKPEDRTSCLILDGFQNFNDCYPVSCSSQFRFLCEKPL